MLYTFLVKREKFWQNAPGVGPVGLNKSVLVMGW